MVIDGTAIANEIIARLVTRPISKKFLAVALVGENPASISFINQKKKIAGMLGVDFRVKQIDESISESDLKKYIKEFGKNAKCGGIIIQLPLPANFDRDSILKELPAEKDVDNLNQNDLVLSPAVLTVEEILKQINFDLKNAKVAIVGLGILVGQPVAKWIKKRAREIILIDKDNDIQAINDANLIITGVGKANLFSYKDVKNNAVVIDFGYEKGPEGKISGDFTCESLLVNSQLFYTPTPGGTGPILVAKLFENFYKLSNN